MPYEGIRKQGNGKTPWLGVDGIYLSTNKSTLHIINPGNFDSVKRKIAFEICLASNFDDTLEKAEAIIGDHVFPIKDGKLTIGTGDFEKGAENIVDDKPFLFPENEYEAFGVEDPRITFIDDWYHVSYSAVSRRRLVSSATWYLLVALSETAKR